MSFAMPTNMPSLSLSIPTERQAYGNIELSEDLLHHWIKRLPSNQPIEFTKRYLDALKRFNTNEVSHVERIKLLDLYREPFNKVLFGLTIPKLKKLVKDPTTRFNLINDMSEVLAELANGYKIVVVEANQRSDNLKLNPLAHMAIYRACEQLSYLALHAYKFYRTVPAKVFTELHQLYMLTEGAGIADKPAFVNMQFKAEFSVKHRYSQIMLVAISNPFGLASGDVLRCYKLMLQLASYAQLMPLPDNGQPLAGHFYINCMTDRTPSAAILPVMDKNSRPPTLVLDTKPILSRVDNLFEQTNTENAQNATSENIRLLKQVVPFLNTSYQRKQPRVEFEGNKLTYICAGLETMHNTLTKKESLPIENDPWLQTDWEVLNKNSYGYLVQKRKVAQAHDLKIGDFVGIVEQHSEQTKPSLKLASIRWLRTDDFQQTKMGLKFLLGDPIPVFFSAQDDSTKAPAFLIRENSLQNQPAMLITGSGIFANFAQIVIKTGKKRFNFTVQPDKLLAQSDDFECFSFKDVLP
jgi:hypothetical protein